MNKPTVQSQDLNADQQSCAAWIAHFLKARGIDRIFGLQGGHIQPIWDHVARQGIRIIDVRDEGAAVHMAHAHAELTGQFGVAMVTAGPGVTNTVTAIANASLARIPVLLIGGCTSRPQANMGPLQDIPHVDILRPVTRTARTARVPDQVVRELDEAVARAMGDNGEPGPVYLEVPTDVLRTHVPPQLVLDEWISPKPPRAISPDPATVKEAVNVFWSAKRPVVITGRGARQAGSALLRLLDSTGALYLDTHPRLEVRDPLHTVEDSCVGNGDRHRPMLIFQSKGRCANRYYYASDLGFLLIVVIVVVVLGVVASLDFCREDAAIGLERAADLGLHPCLQIGE